MSSAAKRSNQIEARMIAGFDREREELFLRHAEEVARLKGEYANGWPLASSN
ncbi:Hypothetical protein NGAL_HAMBI2605_62860 [Neorhizobium galegae bv. orientalis]|nr:Hypothetical protein NGAL_HAMBI2605_62860 [Neorhizobium galegae bv. orientalis]